MQNKFRNLVIGFKGEFLASSEKVTVGYALSLFTWGIASIFSSLFVQLGVIPTSLDMVVYSFISILLSLGILYISIFKNYYRVDTKKLIDRAKVVASFIAVAIIFVFKVGFNLDITDTTFLIAVGTLLLSWALYKRKNKMRSIEPHFIFVCLIKVYTPLGGDN